VFAGSDRRRLDLNDRLSPKRVPFALLVCPRCGDKINFSILVRIFYPALFEETETKEQASDGALHRPCLL
jgi:hypothetical protein